MDETENFMTEFFDEVEEISQSLDNIVTTVEEVKKKHPFGPSTNQSLHKARFDTRCFTAEQPLILKSGLC
ncbi:hypothetical protein JTE90_003714 [Oedothorax gibbosus]|uniref:Uncharacterized protein n=1 Tax=Oedothorax gibbosus TaxID=931172 RepID=A0AAV6VA13_9ARAC|nr:hypothetical protein JTE90_003714 [Oedothorax gibbosus]